MQCRQSRNTYVTPHGRPNWPLRPIRQPIKRKSPRSPKYGAISQNNVHACFKGANRKNSGRRG